MQVYSSDLPKVFLKFGQQVLHIFAVPSFTFLFIILYRPFNLTEYLSLRHGGFAFNATIISVILLGVLLISRLVLWGVRNKIHFRKMNYVLWVLIENLVASLFIAMYISLMSGGEHKYIDLIPIVIVELVAIVYVPYSIISLILDTDIVAKYAIRDDEPGKIRFYDEKHNLKFVTDVSSLLYVESQENYCVLYYAEGGKAKKFVLRNTMKSLEPYCENHGVLRCHRSYFVNTARIKVLRKEREGVNVAELDIPEVPGIPVTPRYYEKISSLL